MKSIFLLSLICFLSGCVAPHQAPVPFTMENNELLLDQHVALKRQDEQLSALTEAQQTLVEQLASVQTSLGALSTKLAEQAPSASDKGVVEESTDDVALANVARPGKERLNAVGKALLGRVEYVWLDGMSQYLKARVDTGSKSSSLNTTNIQKFERNGEDWVRFSIKDGEQSYSMEAPVLGHVRIRQANSDELERRPVVKLTLRLGELLEETEFTLANRDNMLYPVLLGRSFLQDIALVDVAKKFTRRRNPKLLEQASP